MNSNPYIKVYTKDEITHIEFLGIANTVYSQCTDFELKNAIEFEMKSAKEVKEMNIKYAKQVQDGHFLFYWSAHIRF